MKVILSRKGFDSNNGGIPSPIFSDGTLLSMPIPSIYGKPYSEMYYKKQSYANILSNLGYKGKIHSGHLDPDIRPGVFSAYSESWKPLFGQVLQAQGVLRNRGVTIGDLFLFFGTFMDANSNFHYIIDRLPKHVLFGYFQVGEIITDPSEITKFTWHPHAQMTGLTNNTIYVSSKNLSLNMKLPGAGVLDYQEELVLTKEGKKWYVWDESRFPFLKQEYLYSSRRRYDESDGGIVIADKTGQEYVYRESAEITDWARRIISNNY